MKPAEVQRDVREISLGPERPATRGCYRRLLVVVRDGGALPVMSVEYADAWAMPDAVAVIAMLPDAASRTHGAGQGGGGVCGPDIATAHAVRCALLARGVDAGAAYALQPAAGANAAQSIGEMAHRWGADLVLCDDRSIGHLAQAAACNVLFVPIDESRRYQVPPRRIFVASDDSASALCAVTEARRIAGEHAQLRRAYLSFDAERTHPTDAGTIVLAAARDSDNLAHAIVQAAREWGADLLVMGTHGTAAQAVWRYGSVGAAVALVADMPLLLVVGKS
jgi:nucleotide-binding universal stress UspA family protein